jgi:2-polyprenyl-6-methoxyphenol hydroxylase-like FAD-dependent oxidoreductase
MGKIGERAVVIGGSMAGLAAAKVLSEHYEHVIVIERDELVDEVRPRRHVPQGRHLHALLPSGQRVLDELFPGFSDEMASAGAPWCDGTGDFAWILGGHRFSREPSGYAGRLASRPLIETTVRRRVALERSIELIDRCDVVGLIASGDRIDGVRILRRVDGSSEELVPADLVVDCSGRGSRTPERLLALGYDAPGEDQLRVGLAYATRRYRVAPGATGSTMGVIVGPTAECLRGGGAFCVEGDTMVVTLAGMLGDHPPLDPSAFDEWATTLPAPDVAEMMACGEPIDDPVSFKYPGTVRRRYERLSRFPGGLLVMGDAVCSFNPIYGQGMSVALLEATVLRDLLSSGRAPDPRRFFRAVAKVVDVAWDLATGSDLALPQVEGHRSRRTRFLNAYVGRLQAAAEVHPRVAATFFGVAGLVEPPTKLMTPPMMWRAVWAGAGRPRSTAGRRPVDAGSPVAG